MRIKLRNLKSRINVHSLFLLLFWAQVVNGADCFSQVRLKKIEVPYNKPSFISIDSKEYKDATSFLPNGFVMDGSKDYTEYLQLAIDRHEKVLMPNFPVKTSGIRVRSNTKILFGPKSKLILKPTKSEHYAVIAIFGVKNVEIYNANVEGDYGKHLGTSGEWGYGIDIRGSANVSIENAVVTNCWGDGIVISNNPNKFTIGINLLETDNILIKNCFVNYNRRNGITIAGGSNVKIISTIVSNTFGTLPKAGIDIEPDNDKYLLNNILIQKCKFFNNSGGINFYLNSFASDKVSKAATISVKDVEFYNQESALFFGGFDKRSNKIQMKGSILIDGIKFTNIKIPISRRKMSYSIFPQVIVKGVDFESNTKRKQQLMKGIVDLERFDLQY